MPELRFDPLGRRWVLLSPERANRPDGSRPQFDHEGDPAPCDFCAGMESRTPPTVFAIPEAGPWRVRAFANRFPATDVHEVIVHSPGHDDRFEHLDDAHRLDILRGYRDRLRATGRKISVAIMNRGRDAGASRAHEHSQIFGLDVVPPTLDREAGAFSESACVLCTIAGHGETRVAEVRGARVLCNPVPLLPHEILLVPPCEPRFEDASDETLDAIGVGLAEALVRLARAVHADVSANVVLHTAPVGAERFHWHFHIYPRTGGWGGLEVGTELPIVAADPVVSAARLRGA